MALTSGLTLRSSHSMCSMAVSPQAFNERSLRSRRFSTVNVTPNGDSSRIALAVAGSPACFAVSCPVPCTMELRR